MNTRVKHLRLKLNLTQKDFGSKIGLKTGSVCDIEQGRCNVTERCIIAISSFYY